MSAVNLAALLVLLAVLNLSFARVLPFWPARAGYILQMVLAAVGTIYFIRTWKEPRWRVAIGFSFVQIALSVVLIPWRAWNWIELGRPWDGLVSVQLALISVPLVVPASRRRIGIALLALFALESLAIAIYERRVGLDPSIPAEPFVSIAFAAHASVQLFLRDQWQRFATKHVIVEAEEAALMRVAPQFASLGAKMGTRIRALEEAIESSGVARESSAMQRALTRVSTVQLQMAGLAASGEATSSEASSKRASELRARSAQAGALAFSSLSAVVVVMAAASFPGDQRAMTVPIVIAEACSLTALGILYKSRRRPSERRAHVVGTTLFVVLLAVVTWFHWQFSSWGHNDSPFQPFVGHKLLVMSVAMFAPRRLKVGALLVLSVVANAFLFHAIGFNAFAHIPVLEPWATAVVGALGIGYLVMRERRRVAAARFAQAETDASALRRRAFLFLALRDQLNTPLQTLMLRIGTLQLNSQASPALTKIGSALDELVDVSKELARLQEELPPEAFPRTPRGASPTLMIADDR